MSASGPILNVETHRSTDWATRRLFKALARRCRGKTLVVAEESDTVSEALRERGVTLTHEESDARSVVLYGILEELSSTEASSFVARYWEALPPGGRLVVTVPNRDAHASGETANFNRKRLRRLLKPFGKPKLAADQPFRWLTMVVSKPRMNDEPLKPVRRDRYQATVRLCRGQVIELGCGEGHLTRMIQEQCEEAVGVDISEKKISIARHLHPGIRFIRSDIRHLELPDASFDTAVLAEVLEHVPEPAGDEILDRAWRLIRPGGRLILSVPNQDLVPHPNHMREFDRRSLKSLLARYGRPRACDEQPLKWLMMYVDRPT